MTKSAILAVAVAAAVLTACVSEQPDAARAAIARNVERFVDAFNRGDAAAIANLYTDDGLVRLQGAPEASGRAQITGFWQHGVGTGKRLKLETTELSLAGNWAYEVGHATVTGADGVVEADQRYLAIWKKDGSSWRLHRDFANSTPNPPSAAHGP